MSNRVTYLLGAGASYGALPTIKDMLESVNTVIYKLSTDYNQFERDNNTAATQTIFPAIQDLRKLATACSNHSSMDTYAKTLYVNKRKDENKRFKNILILFFELYRYYYPEKIDKRYDAFLAYHLKPDPPRFPYNVNIISWNYDYEFEKAFSKSYPLDASLEEIYEELTAHHKGLHTKDLDFGNFNLVKLNGTIGYNYEDKPYLGIGNYYYKSEQQKELEHKTVCPTIFKAYNLASKCEPLISFAWEKEEPENHTIRKAVEIMKTTTTLVVIGYSFPNFNRDFDGTLLSENNTPILQKIYVEDIDPHTIINRMKEYRTFWNSVEFLPMRDTENFYIPHEQKYNREITL